MRSVKGQKEIRFVVKLDSCGELGALEGWAAHVRRSPSTRKGARSDGQGRRWVRAPPLQTACSGLGGLRVASTRAAAPKEPTPPERPLGAQPRRSPPPF